MREEKKQKKSSLILDIWLEITNKQFVTTGEITVSLEP